MEIVKGFHMANKKGIKYDYQFWRLKSLSSDTMWGEYWRAELASYMKERSSTTGTQIEAAFTEKET